MAEPEGWKAGDAEKAQRYHQRSEVIDEARDSASIGSGYDGALRALPNNDGGGRAYVV